MKRQELDQLFQKQIADSMNSDERLASNQVAAITALAIAVRGLWPEPVAVDNPPKLENPCFDPPIDQDAG